ncbi:MAG: serine/threonine-protein phosphatase [Oscillospiraceae bacterium]|nr:serine/threonine-protein phosphatase [Oscillospiraceae bacterium]
MSLFRRKKKIAAEVIPQKQQGVKMSLDGERFLTVKIGNSSHPGAREYQEDSFGYSGIVDSEVISERGFAAVLADGMGGLDNGRDISRYVVSSFITMFEQLDYTSDFPPQLEDIAVKINDEVCKNFSTGGKSGAGSTLAAVFVYKAKLFWVCIGDSRLYLLRGNALLAANEDHDYFNQLLTENLSGEMTMDEIHAEVQKDNLTSYIGNPELPHIDSNKRGFSICKGDSLVLCSDGIYNGISAAEIVGLLSEYEPQKASEKTAEAVLNQNLEGQDNLTVMVIKFE